MSSTPDSSSPSELVSISALLFSALESSSSSELSGLFYNKNLNDNYQNYDLSQILIHTMGGMNKTEVLPLPFSTK